MNSALLSQYLRTLLEALTAGPLGLLLRLSLAFAKTGLFTFGSGYAMLALMQREIVDKYAWLTAEQFADVVAIAEITPGPITINMATFVGYRVGGITGAIAATFGLIVGPMLAILIIVRSYTEFRDSRHVAAAFSGLRPTVLALITIGVIRLSKTSVVDFKGLAIFMIILASLHFLKLSPIAAAIIGIAAGLLLY